MGISMPEVTYFFGKAVKLVEHSNIVVDDIIINDTVIH